MHYDWVAALAFAATTFALTAAGRALVFRSAALREMRALNDAADAIKLERSRYQETTAQSRRAGLATNLFFLAAIFPFCLSFAARPLWQHALEIVAVLLVFDFFYYWTHRLLFHGAALRKVHALHHQARTPTWIDALFVHPLETTIGLTLYLASIPIVSLALGEPLHPISMAVSNLIFTTVNTINHVFVYLPRFPFRTLHYVTGVHRAHHVDMNHGNFATLTMLYDWLFGTYEKPVHRTTA
jgi:sterol desaturase/sphingolipid hydroxylase (fatty acid hydroxylase superfamily)